MPSPDETRPDPDALLERVQRAEEKAQRGRLRIYFGASAGVGKTFAMLTAGRRARADGIDVVIGVIETHGRSETAALLTEEGGIEAIALQDVPYRDRVLKEFALDAALARHPQLLLLDELAHSNAPGSRHPKRWQDTEEILAAGIDVYTTLNVQHLESLNDVVGGITGVRVQETIPDTFFDAADEVILIDLPAEELLKRLEAGKVYLPEQASRAAKSFFRRGNLMALRELALRRTADRLEGDVQNYRSDEAIHPVWKTEAAMMCCIGPDARAESVVRATARLASQTNSAWHAIYVETPQLQRLSGPERERILRSVRLAQNLGAHTAILANSDGDVAASIVEFARSHNLSRIVLGRPLETRWFAWGRSLGRRLAALAPDADLIELGRAGDSPAAPLAVAGNDLEPNPKSGRRRLHYAGAALSCLVTSCVTLPLINVVHLTNIAMLFLLTVALVAMRWGRGPAVLAAVLNVAAYDFFFVEPRFSFAVSDFQYAFTFGVMLAVGLIIAELTARMRYQARVATHREERARQLYEFSRDLSIVLRDVEVVELGSDVIGRAFRADVRIIAAGADQRLDVPAAIARVPEFEPAIANWAFENQQAAGMGTDTLPGSSWLYLPLKAPTRTRGVLALKPRNRRLLMVPEQMRQLETFAALVAIALERLHYADIAQQALVGMESERLRNSLLSALSHDLRTPLAAVVGLAEALSLTRPGLSAQQSDLANAIGDEARRMNALVNNLLDMARIESGGISLNLQWQPIEEIVGSALQATRAVLAHHLVDVHIDPALPLVQFDAVLIERVFINLLENASKYTPPGSTVRIGAEVRGAALEVGIEDDGPGLPAGREEALFAKFARGETESAQSGVGLGLAICRAIVAAHGGTIRAEAGRARGARFVFTLPLGHPPAVAAESLEAADHA